MFLDGAFVAPTAGFGLRDTRFKAGASSFTPLTDVGLQLQNAAVALPAVGTQVGHWIALGNTPQDLLADVGPLVIGPGESVDVFCDANLALGGTVIGYMVPVTDLA